jgi:hypothetical protein
MQVLAVCAAVVQEDSVFQAAGITPLVLASLCLVESGGCFRAKHYREHLGDNAHGLCQVRSACQTRATLAFSLLICSACCRSTMLMI